MKHRIDTSKASDAFREYTVKYDKDNINILLKIIHSHRVASMTGIYAVEIPGIDFEFFWLLGLLHDIGRFEQMKKYGTFVDAESVDHAELGADILFKDSLIKKFVPDLYEFRQVAETTIRLHNKLKIPDNLEPQTALYTKALRDIVQPIKYC